MVARAGELSYGVIPRLKKELEAIDFTSEKSFIKESITDEDIATVISKQTGIPLEKMVGSEKQKFLSMDKQLAQRVIGQTDAIAAISNAIKRSKAGLQDLNRPLGSFLFYICLIII